jgi:hypothetical protein
MKQAVTGYKFVSQVYEDILLNFVVSTMFPVYRPHELWKHVT